MPLALRFDAEASADLAEAMSWYDERRHGLGRELLAAVFEAADAVRENPSIGARLADDLGSRRVLVKRFPYHLVESGAIFVVAVAHHSRRPGYWRDR